MQQPDFYVPLNGIGITYRQCSYVVESMQCVTHNRLRSVRQKIRDGRPGYLVTPAMWPSFFFWRGKANPLDLEAGLFYSPILVKVYRRLYIMLLDCRQLCSR